MQLFVAGSWVGLEMHQRKLWKRWNDIALKQQPLTALSPALASIRKNIHPLSPYLYGRCSIVESLLFSCQVLQHFSTIPPGFLWSASRTFTLHFIIRAFLIRSFSSFRKACPASSLPALIIYKVFSQLTEDQRLASVIESSTVTIPCPRTNWNWIAGTS